MDFVMKKKNLSKKHKQNIGKGLKIAYKLGRKKVLTKNKKIRIKISKTLKLFFKTHKVSELTRKKIGKKSKRAHKLYSERWKKTEIQIKEMSKRGKEYFNQYPEIMKKRITQMQEANRKRKYVKKTKQQKKNHSKRMKKYYITHTVWNKNKKTGLIPKTAFKKGKLSPGWQGGISKLPYSFEFNNELKESIRKRDNYTCQNCGMTEKQLQGYHKKHDIHHIDYNKKNYKKSNLISLCKSCNAKVNFNRDYWYSYFMYIMEEQING